jgi:hypothetical protein
MDVMDQGRVWQREREKAAALDAAIEYEDKLPTAGRRRRAAGQDQKDEHKTERTAKMITSQDQIRRLNAAAEKLATADEEFRAVCREIAESGDSSEAEPASRAATVTTLKMPRARRGKRGSAAPADDKIRYHPKMQVTCAVCRTGGLRAKSQGGKYYPYTHVNPQTGSPCPGAETEAIVTPDIGDE